MREAARAMPADVAACSRGLHDGCVRSDGHEGLCVRVDGSVVMRRRPDAPILRDATKRVLTTNHPEVTDPVERERLGLDPMSKAMKEIDRAIVAGSCGHAMYIAGCESCELQVCPPVVTREPSIVLTGDEMAAYDAFALAAAKVEAQAEIMQKANADYRAALERVSQHAARRNRPR